MASSIDDLHFQTALGRILSEPELNDRFIADSQAVGRELGLDGDQIAALESAGLRKLRSFSHSLASKRAGLLAKVCPATYELVHQRGRWRELATRFVRRRPPIEASEYPNRTIRDGFWFIEEIAEVDREGQLDDPLLTEVTRFERIVLSVTTLQKAIDSADAFSAHAKNHGQLSRAEILDRRPRRGPHSRIEAFSVDILTVIRILAQGGDPGEPPEKPTIVLCCKQPGWRNVQYANINPRTRDLLQACDGVATCGEIIARLYVSSSASNPETFASGCLGLVDRFVAINALSLEH